MAGAQRTAELEQLLPLPQPSANSGDALNRPIGWLTVLPTSGSNKCACAAVFLRAFLLGPFLLLVAEGCFATLEAQLVCEDAPAARQEQNPAADAKPSGQARLSQEFQVTGESTWLDTGIDIQAGEHLLISATGALRYADAKEDNGPQGLPRGFKDLIRMLPFNDAGRGAVIGRIGDKEVAQAFLVAERRDVLAPVSGRLSIGINQASNDTGDGTYTIRVEVYPPPAGAAHTIARNVTAMPGIDHSLFAKIPRRIADKEGNPGDMVNFLILGSEEAMQRVFTTAGWVKVDADVRGTVLRGILESLSKESYLTMPMSPLYLFGRTQDYGWAHAEPISVIASRNHLRIWKAPFELHEQTVWVGAATHDIGFERDQRNNGLTHKIDPDIDLERDYVEKTLASTGLVSEITHFLPNNSLKEAKTATGGSFHSSGQVLVIRLADKSKEVSPKQP
jgi:hypothetical protein